uniref:Uncharacterized protein n=1 Tax=Anguilla anguilla TaxID=7936 RepID=A0A0E9V6D3_ANGAN
MIVNHLVFDVWTSGRKRLFEPSFGVFNARYCTGCPEINRFGSLCKNCTFLPWKLYSLTELLICYGVFM